MSSSDGKPPRGHSSDDTSRGRRQTGDLLRKRFAMEPRLVQEFEKVLQADLGALDKWAILREEPDVVWKLLRSAGALEGAAAVAFTFLGLNRLPRYLARRARKQPYMLEKPPPPQQSPFAKATPQPPNQQVVEKQVNRSRRRFLFTAMELTFDIGMSLGVGATVAFLASDESAAEQVFVQIPLQPGRSLISDQVCPNLVQEYRRQWKKSADNREVLREPHHEALQLMQQLAQNCRHRQVMERQLREAQGLQSTTPVLIPETGVIPMNEDPLLVMTQEESEELGDVASLVRDQEEY